MQSTHCRSSLRHRHPRNRRGLAVTALVAITVVGCRGTTTPDDLLPGLSIRTETRIRFVPTGGTNTITVPVTVRNNSAKTVTLGWCAEELERLSVSGWKTVYHPVCLAGQLRFLPDIPAGTSANFDFHANDTPLPYPGFRFAESPRIYRVSIGLWVLDDGTSRPLPRDVSVTNAFEVTP